MSLWRPYVPPSLISESVSLPPSSPLLWWCSAQAPWALCPYLSPQEEHLLGFPLRSGCWHCCFSVPKAHDYLGCVHEPRKYLRMNYQIRSGKYSAEAVGLYFTGLQALYLPGLETQDKFQSQWQSYQRKKMGCLACLKWKGPRKTPTVDSRWQAEHSCGVLHLGGDKVSTSYRGD